jgi:hypothetical protein
MRTIINLILQQNSYIAEESVQLPNITFYKHKEINVASYFIINNIDCRDFEEDEEAMQMTLNLLEKEYSNTNDFQTESIKKKILKSFNNNQEASQIDKNTSAIYLIRFNDIRNLNKYRNLVYAIEESPNYFKRYIIPYTEIQVDSLRNIINDFTGRSIEDILSDIANNEDEYYKLLERKNNGSVYELVIRLFSKLPFLQYKFKADPIPLSVERDISQKVKGDLEEYHKSIQNMDCTLDQLLSLENELIIDDQDLEKELNSLLGGDQ